MTTAFQFIPIMRKKTWKKSFLTISKHLFFEKKIMFFFLPKNVISLFCQLRQLVLDQSSSVHPVSESRGVTLSVTHGRRTDGARMEDGRRTDERKSFCLILDWSLVVALVTFSCNLQRIQTIFFKTKKKIKKSKN